MINRLVSPVRVDIVLNKDCNHKLSIFTTLGEVISLVMQILILLIIKKRLNQ